MNAIAILYGGNLSQEAFAPLFDNKNSIELAKEQAGKFPNVTKIVTIDDEPGTKLTLLNKIAELQTGFDFAYFAFADCPFLDPALAGALAERHTKYKADYSYADGYPFGLAPELLAPGTAAILAKIIDKDDRQNKIEKDFLFSVIQKDINAFDIETEISAVDLRCHRLNLCADSKRNLLLLNNFIKTANGAIPSAADVEKIIAEQPEILRTLPAYYPIQVFGGCPSECVSLKGCAFCPYLKATDSVNRTDFMEVQKFEALLEKIIAFSGDAVIGLSLWGELSLHPEKLKLIEAVVSRKELTLVIETCGIGWKEQELEKIAALSSSSVSWIITPDNPESEACAKKLFTLFPDSCFVQTIRTKDSEDETENFYKNWKKTCNNIIIQKYDDFCGLLEKKQASDISPVIRQPCWHIMRDFPILLDGTVPMCREKVTDISNSHGNVFKDSLETIWDNSNKLYIEHCKKKYAELCLNCDEYYTYNF